MTMFTLDSQNKPVAESSAARWAAWMTANVAKRRVAHDDVGPYIISTIFLGVDAGFMDPPELWQTIVFQRQKHDTPHVVQMTLYPSLEVAEAGHLEATSLAKTLFVGNA